MNYNPFSLSGKTILITGASSGIGKATAIECAKAGASLIITGRDTPRLQQTLESLPGENHKAVIADLTSDTGIQLLTDSIEKTDGVVLCAGVNDKALIKNINREVLQKVMDINLYSPVLLIRSLLKHKKLQKYASVVMLSSISAYYPAISNGMYAASKGAINSFSKILALEILPLKGRVNCIQPAFVETDMLKKYTLQEEIEKIRSEYPLGRFAQPEEIAYAAIYFLSDASQWVTGNFFIMDGGFTLR
ncbi:SDR family NAD(P)-dependent oxidoreductase [Culturomica massiliensis]|uniref:SDR family NAD(P)-dependent oxidoreductase n=1 Tax=Culturomica massiliensis TaxID=1841857 RepID=UPI00266EDCC0|nr:SDR family oxidoreductase [Culturomica massiliensis]